MASSRGPANLIAGNAFSTIVVIGIGACLVPLGRLVKNHAYIGAGRDIFQSCLKLAAIRCPGGDDYDNLMHVHRQVGRFCRSEDWRSVDYHYPILISLGDLKEDIRRTAA